jgi:hypothetical protein
MYLRTLAALTALSLLIFSSCSSTAKPTGDLQLISSVTGSGGDHKADAPNRISGWQILQADEETVVLRALDAEGEVYFEAWVERKGRILRVDYLAPLECAISVDSFTGHQIENTCSLEDVATLGITALDFVADLQTSNLAIQMTEQKADGLAEGVCTTAQVVVGGVGGLITTMVLLHEQIFYFFIAGALGAPVGISAAGIGLGAAVFALGTIGAAWGVGKVCDLIGVGELEAQLARCVEDCDSDSSECTTDCVVTASSDEGVSAGLEECNTSCDEASDCLGNCDEAFASDTNLRQTLLSQCVMGCGERGQDCAQFCIDAVNIAIPTVSNVPVE